MVNPYLSTPPELGQVPDYLQQQFDADPLPEHLQVIVGTKKPQIIQMQEDAERNLSEWLQAQKGR